MKLTDHDAVVIHERHGTYTLWMSLGGHDVEIAYRPVRDDEISVLETSLRQNQRVVVSIESGIFIRGVRTR